MAQLRRRVLVTPDAGHPRLALRELRFAVFDNGRNGFRLQQELFHLVFGHLIDLGELEVLEIGFSPRDGWSDASHALSIEPFVDGFKKLKELRIMNCGQIAGDVMFSSLDCLSLDGSPVTLNRLYPRMRLFGGGAGPVDVPRLKSVNLCLQYSDRFTGSYLLSLFLRNNYHPLEEIILEYADSVPQKFGDEGFLRVVDRPDPFPTSIIRLAEQPFLTKLELRGGWVDESCTITRSCPHHTCIIHFVSHASFCCFPLLLVIETVLNVKVFPNLREFGVSRDGFLSPSALDKALSSHSLPPQLQKLRLLGHPRTEEAHFKNLNIRQITELEFEQGIHRGGSFAHMSSKCFISF
jgi:hypothetical protein